MEKTKINNNLQEEARKTSIKLLESIKNAIETYNKLNPNDKIVVNSGNAVHDVSNVIVCEYSNFADRKNSSISLFKRFQITIEENMGALLTKFCSHYIIYKGIQSDCIGIKDLQGYDYNYISRDKYVANCNITNEIGFDDLRLKMYDEGLIGPYQMGKARDEEMLEVLKYASEYFGLTDAKQKIK